MSDGSYLSAVVADADRKRRAHPVPVRVIEYTLGPRSGGEVHRLITTILAPDAAPAADLAALYAQRWEIETTFDEIKTHQRGPKLILRSQYPWGVEQEVYGFLLVHHAIRQLMHQAALDHDVDPDRISFTRSLRIVRRQVPAQAAFSPHQTHRALTRTLAEIGQRLLPRRRHRTCPRVIKRKMSNWPLKRTEHHNWPPPATTTVTITRRNTA
ncbi:transposase [Streptomyces sp. NPDC048483]|uniref:transposase n=1 Tax=Streptomyces sp. NPDC048483 TaxID=3154927 RepID=UPI00343BE9CA